ncbi:MAG: hypothetical protein GEV03_22610 [Streptosporangiales bacterium]|nr:hypothetical protein [Streptosporangiales bacterium]
MPGELLLPPSEGRFAAPYRVPFTGSVSAGLVLHRPADAPAQSTPQGYGSIEHLFFGTDPGVCRGIYLLELTPHQASW